MFSNILGNVAKHSGKYSQKIWGILPNIPSNVAENSGECPQTFREMLLNNPVNVTKHSGNLAKHSRKCRPIFREILSIIPGMSSNI